MKSTKIEIFPDGFDERGDPKGPCVLVLHYHKPNYKRFKAMTDKEREECLEHIRRFEQQLKYLKNDLTIRYPCDATI